MMMNFFESLQLNLKGIYEQLVLKIWII